MRTLTATLASSVFAAAILFGASHLALSSGTPKPAPPVAKPFSAEPAATAAAAPFPAPRLWTDPPARIETRTVAAAPGLDPPAPAAAQEPVRPAALRSDGPKRAEQARRRRMAQAQLRARQTAARTASAAAMSVQAAPSQNQPVAARRVDPITDLLHGLGLGGEG